MFDLRVLFKDLQKTFQKSNLILLDVITARDSAIENLNVMKEMPVPGGKEENYLRDLEIVNSGRSIRKTKEAHHYITSRSRENSALRTEVVHSAINFLDKRMNIKTDGTINNLMKILDAKSSKDLIIAGKDLVSQMFGQGHVSELVSDVCKSSWGNVSKLTENHLDFEDTGTCYALRLRKMTQASCGLLRKLLATFVTLTVHSMATERTVSH